MKETGKAFTAVVLAADRGPGDPVAMAAGVPSKCLAPVGGTPMVLRVLDALGAATEIETRILCGPLRSEVEQERELRERIDSGQVRWVENLATPSASAFHAMNSLPPDTPVLVTTGDHALLSARIVDYFCSSARETGRDLVVGLALHETVAKAFPGTRRTVTKLREGGYCGCNLFAFLTPRARAAAEYWRRVEHRRKKPLRVVGALGVVAVLRYLSGRLSLEEALARISRRMGVAAGAVVLPFPEAAVDVDTVGDLRLVESVLALKPRDR